MELRLPLRLAAQIFLVLQQRQAAAKTAHVMELEQRGRLMQSALAPAGVAVVLLAELPLAAVEQTAPWSVAERRPFDAARCVEYS